MGERRPEPQPEREPCDLQPLEITQELHTPEPQPHLLAPPLRCPRQAEADEALESKQSCREEELAPRAGGRRLERRCPPKDVDGRHEREPAGGGGGSGEEAAEGAADCSRTQGTGYRV